MFDSIVDDMTRLLTPPAVEELDRIAEGPSPGPFSQAAFDANAAGGAEWDARQAVRKALTRLQADRPADALLVMDRAAARLPAGPARDTVVALAARLRGAAAGPPG